MKWLFSVIVRLLGLTICLFSVVSYADQVTEFGDYQLHYNTFESTFITPEIAHQYGLTRSKGQGLLNVAVTTKPVGLLPTSHQALVSGKVTNLLGQTVKLQFVTINEGDAVYYLAPFTKTNDEILKFAVEAKITADSQPMSVTFERHVYVD